MGRKAGVWCNNAVDMTDRQFGPFTVLRRVTEEERIAAEKRAVGAYWWCECGQCHALVVALGTHLRCGHIPLCACKTPDMSEKAELEAAGVSSVDELLQQEKAAREFLKRTATIRSRIKNRLSMRALRESKKASPEAMTDKHKATP